MKTKQNYKLLVEKIMNVVEYFSFIVYWIFWVGSMIIFNVSIPMGILIGFAAWAINLALYILLSYIEDKLYSKL